MFCFTSRTTYIAAFPNLSRLAAWHGGKGEEGTVLYEGHWHACTCEHTHSFIYMSGMHVYPPLGEWSYERQRLPLSKWGCERWHLPLGKRGCECCKCQRLLLAQVGLCVPPPAHHSHGLLRIDHSPVVGQDPMLETPAILDLQ